ncbi:long chain acyl-CoA synthetase 1-like isoform X5 [Durio zibethinus]|uniref:Long chain acyl-CoA synthetase 1-like isoform X5 n=1 Tax=Durio zibethinus TaxID=66656 RepID=A0A6P5ZZ58_DURZI|nr:long chain acyl-CoA synthetase 1-like isoform X5 [Durio zibethinus]
MKVFSAKVDDGREGQDGKPSVGPVYRNLLAKNGYPPPGPDMSTAWSLFSSSVQKHPGNRMLGWRRIVDGKVGPYIWKTYNEVYDEILHIGSALRASGAEPGCRVGIYGANCPQWIMAMEGKENPQEISPPQPFNICTIMYTSGTSGDPKGVVLTHETIALLVYGIDLFLDQFEDKMTVDDMYLSFLPLAHILDRMIEEYFFHKGASVGYYHGNLKELRDDIIELKPTFLAGVPRVYDMIHEGIKKALEELSPLRKQIFYALYKYKLFWMNRGHKHKYASPLADLLAFRKVKAKLGGRLRLLLSGGAPLSSEVEEFLRVTCCAFVVQGYGLTETCGACTIGFPDEMCMVGAVGSPAVYNELRLEEVSDMGYNPLGNPPCGEICVRGKTLFSEYYKNPELTRESFKDGWFHTGDIGQMLPNGVVKIIDRKKNLIKLSQGEYVALEYLENVYGVTPIVDDVWVYGNSFKSMLVAVVVLHEENAKKWAYLNGYTGSLSELSSLNNLQNYVLSELKSTAEKNKMRGFEFIKGVILEPHPFDMERDLVTATLKKKRNNLLKYYQAEIDALYLKLTAKIRS